MSGARYTSSDSTAPLSPNHPLTHTTPVLVPIIRRTARMAVCVPPVMSHGLSAGMVEVETMFDSVFHKRFRSSYDSSPSSTLPVRKRYKGTYELILGTDSEEDEEVEESSDSDTESEDVEDEGPTTEDEDPTAEDEGLAVGVNGPAIDNESYGLDGESHGVDDESHGLDDESYSIDDEGHGIESDRLGLGDKEAVPEGQQWAVPVPERSERVSALRQPTLTTRTYPEDASPMATSAATISVDEDQFIEVGAQLELYRSILQDHTQRLDAMPPILFAKINKDVRELYTRSGAVKDEIFTHKYRFRSLEHEQDRTFMMFGALWRLVLALDAWAGCVDTRMTDMSWAEYDDHRLVQDMLLQQTALQRAMQKMRDRVTVLEQEKDRRER
nr:hypothetical protein [Tanacetum cinerariifolium]